MPAYIQSAKSNWFGGSGSPQTLAFPGNVTAGSLLAVVVSNSVIAQAVTAISDTRGNTFETDGPSIVGATVGRLKIYYVKATTAGANTVSVTWGGGDQGFGSLQVYEVSGRHATAPLDQQASAETAGGGTSPITGPSITPTADNTWVLAAAFANAGGTVFTAGAGFGHLENTTSGAAEDQEQTTATTVTLSFAVDSPFDTYQRAIASFKAAGGGGPVNGPRIGSKLLRPNAFAPGFGR